MLRIDGLTYRIGQRTLFDNASASIHPGHRVGLVGRNGSGKTTLLRLICGQSEPDSGTIEYPERQSLGVTVQEAPSGTDSLINTVLAADKERTALEREAETATDPDRIAEIHSRLRDIGAHSARSRAARILAGLGFSEQDQQQPCDSLSGGWRMRVGLAALLFTQPDILLLDEPTNHLDLEATVWLEDFLRRYAGTVLIVSHDRDLLNRAVFEIIHLEAGKLTHFTGNYDQFENARRLRMEQLQGARKKQDAQRERITKFVEKFRYKATKARQAQSRLKMLERMQPIPEIPNEPSPVFGFPEPVELPPPLFNLDRVTLGYDDKPVLNSLSLRLDADDRIALIGANGNGKSTFIKLLAGRLQPMSGAVGKSRKLRVGYFAQHQTDELDLDATPIVSLARIRPRDREDQLRAHLGRFGFAQTRAETRVGDLSGGEKARLLFALMSCAAPQILLLDEPTNHLDMESREALVQAINDFPGAVVIVSHDPHVIELTADRLWLVADGDIQPYDGDLSDYKSLVLQAGRSEKPKPEEKQDAAPALSRKDQKRLQAEQRQKLAPIRQDIRNTEKMIERLQRKKAEIIEELAEPALYDGKNDDLIDLQRRHGEIERDLAEAEEEWLALQERMESAETDPIA